MWAAPWICALIAVVVEVVKVFVLSSNARRDELRRRIACLHDDMRSYNPQTEYARYVRADRELKQLQSDQQQLGDAPVPPAQRMLLAAPYVFVLGFWAFGSAPLLSVDSQTAADLHHAWWWPLSWSMNSPLLASAAFAWACARVASLLVARR